MKLINLTPHPICLEDGREDGHSETIPASGRLARVSTTPGKPDGRTAGGVPVYSATSFGEVEGIPAPEEGVLYIVSGLVAGRVKRADVCSPGTGPQDGAIRDAKGQIVAVTRLICSL